MQTLSDITGCGSHSNKPESNNNINIICDVGLNYQSFISAIEYAEKSKEIGADIVKYQITNIDKTWKKNGKDNILLKEMYNNVDIHGNIKSLEMPEKKWQEVKNFCDNIGIEFMASVNSIDKIKMLIKLGVKKLSIDSCNSGKKIFNRYFKKFNEVLISNSVIDNEFTNMYCIDLNPCDKKYISFTDMNRYIGFIDNTIEYDKEWCNKIKSRVNIKYVEKHFKLDNKCIDNHVSLDYNEMREFINNIKGER